MVISCAFFIVCTEVIIKVFLTFHERKYVLKVNGLNEQMCCISQPSLFPQSAAKSRQVFLTDLAMSGVKWGWGRKTDKASEEKPQLPSWHSQK